MPPRLPSLLTSPIGFAHRGARAHAPENTIEAFQLARKLGATGLESDVWLTSDGVAVLDHDGKVGRVRRRPINQVTRAELPDHIPSLEEFYEQCGSDLPVSLDMKDPDAFEATIDVARNVSSEAEENLWICHYDLDVLLPWRRKTTARLVDSTRLAKMKNGPERRADRLRNEGIDAVNLRRGDWNGGLITTFHRFDRLTMGWDAQHEREILQLLDAGIDAVFSDHVDRMSSAFDRLYPVPDRDGIVEGSSDPDEKGITNV